MVNKFEFNFHWVPYTSGLQISMCQNIPKLLIQPNISSAFSAFSYSTADDWLILMANNF